jgi:hypothetical protein
MLTNLYRWAEKRRESEGANEVRRPSRAGRSATGRGSPAHSLEGI